MRRLKVCYVLSSAGKPILLSATLLGACGSHPVTVGSLDAQAATDASALNQDVNEVLITLPPYDARGDVGVPVPTGPVVATPAGGTLATLPDGCIDLGTAGLGADIAGSRTARVAMEWVTDSSGKRAPVTLGRIRIAPEIVSLMVGLPTVEVTAKSPASASDPVISNVRTDGNGFAFDAAWPSGAPNDACWNWQEPSWIFRTTLRLQCGGQERTVEASTTVALCGAGGRTWGSSGDACAECAQVCEMAPSPVVPAKADDDLPLASALSVALRALVRIDDAVVLLAEHAATGGLDYAWQVSAGTIEHLDRDVVLWRRPGSAGERVALAQVAITGTDLAAVASFRWDRQAA